MICHLNKWKSWFLNTEVVGSLHLKLLFLRLYQGIPWHPPPPFGQNQGAGWFLGSQFLVIQGPFFEMVETFVLKERAGIDLPSWISLQQYLLLLFRHDWLNSVEMYGLSVHEKGVKGVELGKCSLLSEKSLTRGTPLPPLPKVRELGKITGFFRELSPMHQPSFYRPASASKKRFSNFRNTEAVEFFCN